MTNQTYIIRDEILNEILGNMEKVKQKETERPNQEIKDFNKTFDEIAQQGGYSKP